jgi:hypothetical protein
MFKRFPTLLLLAVLAAGPARQAAAFSLLGPFEAWQTAPIGYNTFNTDIGGPHNLGEEYRWNLRTITYGFDESFLNYFGAAGTAAVHQAVAIINAIPRLSKTSSNLAEFPLDTRGANFQASALNLIDLKSTALNLLVEELGLADPERYTWTLRDRRIINTGGEPITNYTVIMRNFDPVTLAPSRYVNGVLYTYQIVESTAPTFADAVEVAVDPTALAFSSVAGGVLNFGQFYSGLTRDDIGGLRYLYRNLNYNIESLVPGSTGTLGASPWLPIGSGTNTNVAVNVALRPGIDQFLLRPAKFDSLVGAFIRITNDYTDSFVTNNRVRTQRIRRTIAAPDILFSAEDLGLLADGSPIPSRRTLASAWINNNAINGSAALAGPGVINPQIVITFNKVGPFILNATPFSLDELNNAGRGFIWGSFDGSADPPVVYPIGTTIQDLELQILGGGGP